MENGNAIDRAAAHWVARSAAGLSAAEKAALDAWKKADPRHSGSYLRALAIERLAAASQGVQAAPDDAVRTEARPSGFSRRTLIGTAVAASLAVAIGVSTYAHFLGRVSTERGEIRNVALSDGSAAVLNTSSSIAVAMTQDRRTIDLVEGDAWFDVAHDQKRPFEVRHGDVVVRATGTAFQVSALPDGMEVTVTEGSVAVLRDGAAAPIARLEAGGRLTLDKRGMRQEMLDSARVEQHLAWRQGMIVLDGDALADAIGNVNRYNAVQIRIASPALAQRRVYGTFRTRDPEGLAAALATALDAKVEREDTDILLKQ